MKFSTLLKNIFYFSESKELQIAEYSLPKKIEDFNNINFSAFLKSGTDKEKIEQFEKYALSDDVKLSQLLNALDYETSKQIIDKQKYYELKELEDDLKKDPLVKAKDFAYLFFNALLKTGLVRKENEQYIKQILDSASSYGVKEQKRELENYEKQAARESDRYNSIISNLRQSFDNPQKLKETLNKIEVLREKSIDELNELLKTDPILFEEDPNLYNKRLNSINTNYDQIKIDAIENVTNPKKLEENIEKIQKMKIQAIQKTDEYASKASYIADDTEKDAITTMARNLIAGIGVDLNDNSLNLKKVILKNLILDKIKQSNAEIEKLSDQKKKTIKEIEKEKIPNFKSLYGTTKSKDISSTKSKDISTHRNIKSLSSVFKEIDYDNLNVIIWDKLNEYSLEKILDTWKENKEKIIQWWENLPQTINTIITSPGGGYHILNDGQKIFYRLLNPKQGYFGNEDVSQAAYDKMLQKSHLSLLPPSIIAKIKEENKSKNPEQIFNKINKVIDDIKSEKLVPKEILDTQLRYDKQKIEIEKLEKERNAKREYDLLDKLTTPSNIINQKDKDKEDNIIKTRDELMDKIERYDSFESDFKSNNFNYIFQVLNNLNNFLDRIQSSPNKKEHAELLQLSINDLNEKITTELFEKILKDVKDKSPEYNKIIDKFDNITSQIRLDEVIAKINNMI